MKALATAARGKGVRGFLRRVGTVASRYGLGSHRVANALDCFGQVLSHYGCAATFPVTATTLAGSNGVIERHRKQGIEFAVHGYQHVDHTQLPREKQREHMEKARRLFREKDMAPRGFRAPYLRWNQDTMAAVREAGFLYDASSAIAWDLTPDLETPAYRRALTFYGAVSAAEHPSLPRLNDGLVRIPYSLPDDEALVERLHLKTEESMSRLWLDILHKTHRLGELFTLGLHPERYFVCEAALVATLQQAFLLRPRVWVTRLDDIAQWWTARMGTKVTITETEAGLIHVRAQGPEGLTILARGVELIPHGVEPWDGKFQTVQQADFLLRALRRPFIGVSPSSSPRLVGFLRQQGFIVEVTTHDQNHTQFLDRQQFTELDERPLLSQIEQGEFPLVRFGRWPQGARSALCVTGDIDALTLWDYAKRLLPC